MSENILPQPHIVVGMHRRIEHWRPLFKLEAQGQLGKAHEMQIIRGIRMGLIDIDEKLLDFLDMVVDGGLDALCSVAFDSSGSREAAFEFIGLGTNNTAPAATQTSLQSPVMNRVTATYGKDSPTGECSLDAEFSIDGTYALNECGAFNELTGGDMYCRDTFTTKNVESGDTVKAFLACPECD